MGWQIQKIFSLVDNKVTENFWFDCFPNKSENTWYQKKELHSVIHLKYWRKHNFSNTQTVMAVYCVNEDTNPSSEYLLHTLQKVYETIKICVNMIELPLKTSSVILMPVFMVWNSCNPQWNQNLWRSPTLNGTTSLEMWSNASSHLPRLAGHELSNLHICDVTLPLKISVRGSQCPKLLPIKSNE